jgi:hypothetical protein
MVNTEKEELYGTWHLVSYVERTGNGEETKSFGQAPRSILNYGRDGRMCAMVVKDERPKIAGSREPTDHELASLFTTMGAYGGTFTVDGDRVTHHVDISWNGSWTGTDQVRTFRVEGRKLFITSVQPESVASLVWEKWKSNH